MTKTTDTRATTMTTTTMPATTTKLELRRPRRGQKDFPTTTCQQVPR